MRKVDRTGTEQEFRLMESGWVRLPEGRGPAAYLERSMVVSSLEGQEIGQVAAVILDTGNPKAERFLLGRLPTKREYRIVPAGLIQEILPQNVRLKITTSQVDDLEVWSSFPETQGG